MNIIKDDLLYHIKEYDVITIGSDIKNSKGNGFKKRMCVNFPEIFLTDEKTPYNDKRKLGKIKKVEVNKEGIPTFLLCYIFKGRYRPDLYPDALNYNALEQCLIEINKEFKGKRVASTIMGESPYEGGGNRERIINIFTKNCKDIDLTLFDFKQNDFLKENAEKWHNIIDLRKEGKISIEEYRNRKKAFLWEENIGIYTPMPDLPESDIKELIKKLKK